MSLFSAHSHPHELFMRGLLLGGATVLTEGRYPRTAMDLIADAGVTVLMGLPPQLDGLARSAGRERRSLSRLRLAEAGACTPRRHFFRVSMIFRESTPSLSGEARRRRAWRCTATPTERAWQTS